MKGVTEKQKALLSYISQFIKKHHYSPSLSEIQSYFGYKSLATVHQHLESLKKKGHLTSEKNSARSLSLTESPSETIDIPIVGQFASSHPIELYKVAHQFVTLAKSQVNERANTYFLQVRGDGMVHEQIQNLDLLLIEALPTLNHGDVGLFTHSSGATLLKRYYPEEEFARLEPLVASNLPTEAYRHHELKIHGRLITLVRNYSI